MYVKLTLFKLYTILKKYIKQKGLDKIIKTKREILDQGIKLLRQGSQ